MLHLIQRTDGTNDNSPKMEMLRVEVAPLEFRHLGRTLIVLCSSLRSLSQRKTHTSRARVNALYFPFPLSLSQQIPRQTNFLISNTNFLASPNWHSKSRKTENALLYKRVFCSSACFCVRQPIVFFSSAKGGAGKRGTILRFISARIESIASEARLTNYPIRQSEGEGASPGVCF